MRHIVPAGVLLAGAILRIIYLMENRANPFFLRPVLDSANYDNWAVDIMSGKGMTDVFIANPFYPFILSVIYKIFSHDYLVVRVVQACVGILSCVFIWLTTKRIFGATAGLAALLFAAFYGPFLFFEGELLAEVWTVMFISLALFLFSFFTTEPKSRYSLLAFSGFAIGLACLSRPNIIIYIPVAVAWVIWRFKPDGWKSIICGGLIYCAGVAIAITPVTAHNALRGGDRVLVTAHGGINFFIGNNKDANGWFKIPPESKLEGGQLSLIESASIVAETDMERKLNAMRHNK